MATDSSTALPIRTNANGDAVVEICDGTTTSQKLSIDASGRITTKLDDGNGNIVTSQTSGTQRALDVGIDVAGVQVDPRQIRPLTSSDVVTAQQGTTPWVENLTQVGGAALALGQTTMSASLPVTLATNQSTVSVKDTADGPVAAGTAASNSMLGGLVGAATSPTLTAGQQVALQGDLAGNLKVNLQTSLPAGANAIGSVLANLQVASAAVSNTNPVPVSLTTSAPGTAIQSYQSSASLAAGASVTLTYTVATGHTFNLQRVWVSAPGRIRADVQNGTTTIYTGFNSTATPNIDITVTSPPTIAAAGTVNVIITNDDIVSLNIVTATIEGNQN